MDLITSAVTNSRVMSKERQGLLFPLGYDQVQLMTQSSPSNNDAYLALDMTPLIAVALLIRLK